MITFKELITEEDFESLKPGDFVACEFNQDIRHGIYTYRFNVFKVASVKKFSKIFFVESKPNMFFNYRTCVKKHPDSTLKKAILISHYQED